MSKNYNKKKETRKKENGNNKEIENITTKKHQFKPLKLIYSFITL